MHNDYTNNHVSKISEYFQKKPYLHWWIPDTNTLSDESVVFSILNYGDFDDVKLLLKEMGIQNVKKIFEKQIHAKRNNYNKKTQHYFSLYFDTYA